MMGGGRFTLDILRKVMGYDLGALNAAVAFSFLNFSVIVFFLCVALMVILSRVTEKPLLERIAGLTFGGHKLGAEEASPEQQRNLGLMTALVALAVLMLWFHFR
jgi:hypothetical protein